MTKKIKLMLHHNYLQIEHEGKTLQLPVRCAKLIKDMYNARNAKNENDDLAHYSKDGFENPPYEVSVMLMNAGYDSELQWITKKINPIEGKKNDKR